MDLHAEYIPLWRHTIADIGARGLVVGALENPTTLRKRLAVARDPIGDTAAETPRTGPRPEVERKFSKRCGCLITATAAAECLATTGAAPARAEKANDLDETSGPGRAVQSRTVPPARSRLFLGLVQRNVAVRGQMACIGQPARKGQHSWEILPDQPARNQNLYSVFRAGGPDSAPFRQYAELCCPLPFKEFDVTRGKLAAGLAATPVEDECGNVVACIV